MDAIVSHSTSITYTQNTESKEVISNTAEVEEIHNAAAKGMKIGLVIGREVDQPVSQREGWLWVSGNIEGDPAILENRVHLQLDFNQSETCDLLQGLFDTVVVDASTLKFMSAPWSRFAALLKPEPSSMLITERMKVLTQNKKSDEFRVDLENGTIYFSMDMQIKEWEEEDAFYEEWETNCSEEEGLRLSEEFLNSLNQVDREYYSSDKHEFNIAFRKYILDTFLPDRYQCLPEARRLGINAIKDHLSTLFDRVEMVENRPYPTREDFDSSNRSYFVLTGPKPE